MSDKSNKYIASLSKTISPIIEKNKNGTYTVSYGWMDSNDKISNFDRKGRLHGKSHFAPAKHNQFHGNTDYFWHGTNAGLLGYSVLKMGATIIRPLENLYYNLIGQNKEDIAVQKLTEIMNSPAIQFKID